MKRPIMATGVLLGVLAGCGGSQSTGVLDTSWERGADAVMSGVEAHMTSSGLPRGYLWADTAYGYDDSAKYHLRRPRVDIYDEKGEKSAHLVGVEGDIYLRTELMVVRGQVVLTTVENDRRITTEELHFDCQSNRIWSDSATDMVEGSTRVRGSGFSADCHMRNLQVHNANVTGFRPPE